MIAFDFLNDPRVTLPERLRGIRISGRSAGAALAVATALAVVAIAGVVESERLHRSTAEVARLQDRYAVLRARLDRERLDAGETADLGALDGRLREIGDSAFRLRSRLVALSDALPRDVWLVSLHEGTREQALVGRGRSVAAAARALRAFRGARLERVSRIERGAAGALLEFAFRVDR